MRRIYTPEHLQFLRAHYLRMQIPEVTAAFNRTFGLTKTESQIKAALKNHGIRCGRPPGNPEGTYRLFTSEQAEFLRNEYKLRSLKELTAAYNLRYREKKTRHQLRAFVRNHHLQSGRTGHFGSKHKPWNAGTKGQGLTSANRNSFRTGNKPHTWQPIGTERISKEGYRQRKVTDLRSPPRRDWVAAHILLWTEHHGPPPAGHAVIFLDGDKSHIEINNLILVSRAELLHLNRLGYRDTPPELKPSVLALARLETKRFSLNPKTRMAAQET